MLRIIQNQAADSAKSYYSHGDYLSEGQEQHGQWGGSGAVRLGFRGDVTKAAFDCLCDNQNPQTGEQLTPRTRSDRIVGYDFNFHVPKKVSIGHALNQDEHILHAFEQSVDETMREIEQDANTRIRTGRLNSEWNSIAAIHFPVMLGAFPRGHAFIGGAGIQTACGHVRT